MLSLEILIVYLSHPPVFNFFFRLFPLFGAVIPSLLTAASAFHLNWVVGEGGEGPCGGDE
jgi:hypothetical protein